jgi:hypothetical protein
MKALKDLDPEGPKVSHGLKSALKCIFALHIYIIMIVGPVIYLGGLGDLVLVGQGWAAKMSHFGSFGRIANLGSPDILSFSLAIMVQF